MEKHPDKKECLLARKNLSNFQRKIKWPPVAQQLSPQWIDFQIDRCCNAVRNRIFLILPGLNDAGNAPAFLIACQTELNRLG